MPLAKHKSILLIERDQGIQFITQLNLELEAGWQVLTATSGSEGIIKAESSHPDAILLDVLIDDSLFETLRKLKTNLLTHIIPIILFTAKVHQREICQFQQTPAVGILTKPFEPLSLATQITDLLGW